MKKPHFLLLLAIFTIFACMAIFISSTFPQKINPSSDNGSISMVQPCGWPWCYEYDSNYAQNVNVPNSQANHNNGEANYYNAVATKTVAEAELAKSRTQPPTMVSFALGMVTMVEIGVGVIFVVFMIYLLGTYHKSRYIE